MATAEALIADGKQLDDPGHQPGAFARALYDLVRLASFGGPLPSLHPPMPWIRPDHDQDGTWPRPLSSPDLNGAAGPRWIDDAARRVRARLARSSSTEMVGHGDFESQNLRWLDGHLLAVYDWDSAVSRPETTIAGAAAAVFPTTGRDPEAADVEATAEFLRSYGQLRSLPWGADELEACWAAGLWVLLYNAKVQWIEGGSALATRLADQIDDRMRRAGL